MKRILPLLCLLVFPHLSLAQPAPADPPQQAGAPTPAQANAKDQPDFALMARMTAGMAFAFNEDNGNAVAMMGAVYNSFQKAKSYDGHWVMTQTTVKDGIVTGGNSMDLTSVWQRDPQTGVFKSRVNMVYTTTENGKTTPQQFVAVNDGQKTYRYYSDRNVWMEEPQTDKSADNQSRIGLFLPWTTTLLRVAIGTNLKTEKRADGTTAISSDDQSYQATFNPDGTLQSWKSGHPGKSVAEVHFDRFSLNTSLPAHSFVWKAPQGAQQIPPEEPKNNFNFNFDF